MISYETECVHMKVFWSVSFIGIILCVQSSFTTSEYCIVVFSGVCRVGLARADLSCASPYKCFENY